MTNVLSSRTTMSLTVSDALVLPVDVDLEYDALDPCAVQLVLRTPGRRVAQVFARDLLLTGITHPSGEGDVHIQPVGTCDVAITLRTPGGDIVLRAQAAALAAFLIWTDSVVPFGDEPVEEALETQLPWTPAPTAGGGASYALHLESGDMALSLSGELDYGQAATLARAARAADRPGDLHVDMSEVTFMDSTGLNFLAGLRRQARDRCSALFVSGLQAQPLGVTQRVGFPLLT